jgi:DNA primase
MTLVDDDFHGWLVDQAQALHTRRSELLDWDALAEELEAMAAKERREARKHLRNLLAHLLKWSFQSEELSRRAHSWRRTIRETREELSDLLEDSPGLLTSLNESFAKVYERARNKASDETKLPLDRFPASPPWTIAQAMREEQG